MKKRCLKCALLAVLAIGLMAFPVYGAVGQEVEDAPEELLAEGYMLEAEGGEQDLQEVEILVDQYAASSYNSGGVKLTLDDQGVLTLSGNGAMVDYDYTYNVPWQNIKSQIKKVIVGSGVTKIGKYAFAECTNLESIDFSGAASLETIGESAFYGCTSLSDVTLPASLKTLDMAAFANCSSLKNITLNNGLTSIKQYAFQYSDFATLTLPASVTEFDAYAVLGNTQLTSVQVASGNKTFSSSDGIVYKDGGATLVLYPAKHSGTSFTVPGRVTSVGAYAFGRNTLLQSVAVPNSVTELGDSAFYSCSALKSVVLGDGIKEIGFYTFEECRSLENVTFGKGLEIIWHRAFTNCTSLKEIVFPEGLREIWNSSFFGCTALTKVTFPSTLEMITFQAFSHCTALQNFTLPEGLKEINRQAFYKCESLTYIKIPDSVTLIGEDAFSACPNLELVYSDDLKPQTDGSYLKTDTIILEGTYKYSLANEVLALVNQERQNAGLNPLSMDQDLLSAAMTRSSETAIDFSHTRTNGLECFSISTKASAENIAAGSSTAAGVMDQWMNSEGHKANILDGRWNSIGVGCFVHNGVTYWVQLFGSANASAPASMADQNVLAKVEVYPGKYTIGLSNTDLTLNSGDTRELRPVIQNPGWESVRAVLIPENYQWQSSDTSVAAVNSSGLVTANKPGQAVITVSTADGTYSAKCTVTVSNPSGDNSGGNTGGNTGGGTDNGGGGAPVADREGVAAFVTRLYENILQRTPDNAGLNAWVDVLSSGKESGAKVAQGFVDSTEFKSRNMSDEEYIKIMYRTFLGREYDQGGLNAWMSVLDSGLSRMHVFKGFAESNEFTGICSEYGIVRGNAVLTEPRDQNENVTKFIVRNYRLCLGREPDVNGLNAWCSQILTGVNTAKQAAYGFVFSNEFKGKNLSDEDYVRTLYRVFMDREADNAGLESWLKVLREGESREHVFNGFADSPEFREICQSYGIL
ncbi:leucine-rich repeat protein [Catenibacillus scindens]|uniref:leucine-rich repeat protein n=1 Tax=Catenibacillus scindens TaxID=673271 RepID=UPI003208AAEF